MKELPEISKVFINVPVEAQSQIVDKVYETISNSNPLASECEHINQIQVKRCPRCGDTHFQNTSYCHTDSF